MNKFIKMGFAEMTRTLKSIIHVVNNEEKCTKKQNVIKLSM